MEPVFFTSPAAFGEWLERHHATETELWVGFWKVGTGQPTLTWSEAVDEALRFGWIDGVRRTVDAQRYTNRFTPRKRGSNWSEINLRKVDALIAAGRMHPAGLAAWEARDLAKTQMYSFERANATFEPAQERAFKANRRAWAWWQAQPPGYRKVSTHWVTSARRDETRARRLETLIAECAAGRRLGTTPRPARSS